MINVHILCSNCPPPAATVPHTLIVSFATLQLQLLYQLCDNPAYPIPQQSGDFQRIFKS